MEVRGTVDIGRPVADVFGYIMDVSNNPKWETGVLEMEWTSEPPIRVGSTGRRVESQMGRDEGTWEITEWEENKVAAMTFESPRFAGAGGWQFEENNGGTQLTYWFRGDPKPLLWKLLVPLFSPMFRRQVKKDFLRLKGILESAG